MVRILSGKRYSVAEVAGELGVHVSTVWRWTLRGVRGHKLPTLAVGGKRFVREEDLVAFFDALNNRRTDDPKVDERAALANAQLDAMGVREVRRD